VLYLRAPLKLMSNNLKRDICDLLVPSTHAGEIESYQLEQCFPLEL